MVFDAAQIYVASPLPVPVHKYMHIIVVPCLEWWNSHFIIRCSFETGNWTQIPQAFPTLWRMLMSRIQHLRTRLPVHIGSVPVGKPGEETKDKNHQSTTPANTLVANRNSSASAQQCSNIFGWKAHVIPTSFGNVRFFSAICQFARVSPQIAETYPNSKLQAERTSFLADVSTHDIHSHHSSCHIKVCYLKHQGSQAYFHTKEQRSHNIQATAATVLDSPDISSQPQSQK